MHCYIPFSPATVRPSAAASLTGRPRRGRYTLVFRSGAFPTTMRQWILSESSSPTIAFTSRTTTSRASVSPLTAPLPRQRSGMPTRQQLRRRSARYPEKLCSSPAHSGRSWSGSAESTRSLFVSGRPDVWADLLEPFLDTKFTAEHRSATLDRLRQVGLTAAEVTRIRDRVGPLMLAYNAIHWD